MFVTCLTSWYYVFVSALQHLIGSRRHAFNKQNRIVLERTVCGGNSVPNFALFAFEVGQSTIGARCSVCHDWKRGSSRSVFTWPEYERVCTRTESRYDSSVRHVDLIHSLSRLSRAQGAMNMVPHTLSASCLVLHLKPTRSGGVSWVEKHRTRFWSTEPDPARNEA